MKEFNLEEYLENPERKVVTRDGKSVKIHCTNYLSEQLVIAEIEGLGYSTSFDKYGRYNRNKLSINDLFFAPEKHEGWIIINKLADGERDTNGIIYHTKLDIPDIPIVGGKRVATIKIEWEE